MPKNNETLIKIRYFENNLLFDLISGNIFFLSTIKAIGKTVIKPTKNLAELKDNGPMLSIPVSCAIKAVPQINVVINAQIKEVVLDI